MKYYNKQKIHSALYIIKCDQCGDILSSASDYDILPNFSSCNCDEIEDSFDPRNDLGGTGHGDESYSDANPGL